MKMLKGQSNRDRHTQTRVPIVPPGYPPISNLPPNTTGIKLCRQQLAEYMHPKLLTT